MFAASQVSSASLEKPALVLLVHQDDVTDSLLGHESVEAGIALALELSRRFVLLPSVVVDSILLTRGGGDSLTAARVAELVGAKHIAFVAVRRVHHLLRAEVSLVDAGEPHRELRGYGWATIRFFQDSSRVPVADPAILQALQRAIAHAVGDSALYCYEACPLPVIPATLVAVGGFEFRAADGPDWLGRDKGKILASYAAVISATHALAALPGVVVVDVDTRDSMYALSGYYMVENYNPITATECVILYQFGVEYVLSGVFLGTERGTILTIELGKIGGNKRIQPVTSRQAVINSFLQQEMEEAVGRETAAMVTASELPDGRSCSALQKQ